MYADMCGLGVNMLLRKLNYLSIFLGESFVRLASLLRQQKSEAMRISRSATISFPDSIDDLEIAEEMNQRQRLPNSGFVPFQYNDTVIVPNDRATSQVSISIR